jgi:hypothetical protein
MLNKKESNMKQLNKQQQKVVDTLFANLEHNFWSADFVRLPQNRTLIKLLNELDIPNSSMVTDEKRFSKPAGFVYTTSGGGRTYTSHKLKVASVNLDLTSENRHRCQQGDHASKIIALIHCNGFDLQNKITEEYKHSEIRNAIEMFNKNHKKSA